VNWEEFLHRGDLQGGLIFIVILFVFLCAFGYLEDKYPDHDPKDDE
jgi:hypothetical protein